MESVQTVIKNAAPMPGASHDIWMYAAVMEFVLLVVLCVRLCIACKRRSERGELKKRVLKEGDIDFANVINSSFKAKALYDELKKECHPDKFAKDEAMCAKATEIFGSLVGNKHNYAALCELKERARNELHIDF